MKNFYVYILASNNNRVIYIGVTNDLQRRLYEHKNHLIKGFSDRYNTTKLVYFVTVDDANSAIAHEKRLKGITRAKKDSLINEMNPDWHDLSLDWENS